MRDAIEGIAGLIEDTVIDLVTAEGHNEVKRADYRLQAMLQGLFNKKLDEKLNSVEIEDSLLRKIEEVTPSRWIIKKMKDATLEDRDVIAPVETTIKKETKKSVDAGSERKDRRQKLVEIAYSTGIRSASSSDDLRRSPPMN